MTTLSLINSNETYFKNAFKSKLLNMLNKDELGSFILVLANSMQDPQLQKSLAIKINSTFQEIANNPQLSSAPDDLAIFNALIKTGIKQYDSWKVRKINHWQCSYNPFRALRPERSSKEIFTGLLQDFNHDAFHFSKPFLRPEIISEENFNGLDLQVMYQKFPFAPFHLLIVFQAQKFLPQFLNEETHQIAWNLNNHLRKNINGFCLSYNSLGAGASVNQLHFHGSITEPLAIEHPCWIHNTGSKNYPLKVDRTSSASKSWKIIRKLHQNNQPYNLLYSSGYCYVISRTPQKRASLPSWLPSIGWYEACGGFNLSKENDFSTLSSSDIESALSLQ